MAYDLSITIKTVISTLFEMITGYITIRGTGLTGKQYNLGMNYKALFQNDKYMYK